MINGLEMTQYLNGLLEFKYFFSFGK